MQAFRWSVAETCVLAVAIILCAAAVVVPALAQDKRAAEPSQEALRVGVVTRDDVNLRAGPSTAYEVVAKLPLEQRVTVIGSAFGWYRVRVEAEVPVYVSGALVEVKEGSLAVVTGDRVNLRARPSLESSVVAQAAQGEPVRVLEAGPAWVRVAAPAHAAFFLHGSLVELRASAPPVAEATGPDGAMAARPEPPAAPEILLQRAAELYNAELTKPRLEDMDVDPALELFQQVLARTEDPALVQAAQAGIRRAEVIQRLQQDLKRRKRVLDEAMEGA